MERMRAPSVPLNPPPVLSDALTGPADTSGRPTLRHPHCDSVATRNTVQVVPARIPDV